MSGIFDATGFFALMVCAVVGGLAMARIAHVAFMEMIEHLRNKQHAEAVAWGVMAVVLALFVMAGGVGAIRLILSKI